MKSKKLRLDLSSIPLTRTPGAERLLEQSLKFCDREGFELGIQIHNTSSDEEFERCIAFGLPLSAHLPLKSDFQINLAAAGDKNSEHSLAHSIALMREHKINAGVFHGFAMTDNPMPSFGRGRSYDESMAHNFRPELALGNSRICCDFFGTDEFIERRERVKKSLKQLREIYPDLELCIENDFPAYGAANLLTDTAIMLDHPVCLDSSHLWASCFVFDRDFHEQTLKLLTGAQVRMVHLHASKYDERTVKENWSDGHLGLHIPNKMHLERFVRACRDANVKHIVLEIFRTEFSDLELFAKMWNS